VQKRVKAFIAENFSNKKYISVQYRGTDKFFSESDYISPEQACGKIAKILKEKGLNNRKIFVATDTERFMKLMKAKFGKRIVTIQATLSTDGTPVHVRNDVAGFQKGIEALLDCLIISKSSFLIRTASNLSSSALLFNPKLESICLNKNR
jgi:hypothetical protein